MFGRARKDKLIQQKRHDPYRPSRGKESNYVCEQCNAWLDNGRWRWDDVPEDLPAGLCPACRRTNEGFAAGTVELSGAFLNAHEEEIRNLILNLERQARERYPMQRIMKFDAGIAQWKVETTEVNLARTIGEAINRAYGGDLRFDYADDDARVRVWWARDA